MDNPHSSTEFETLLILIKWLHDYTIDTSDGNDDDNDTGTINKGYQWRTIFLLD